jgi:ankyrin repeat protein
LVKAGADVLVCNKFGYTPIHDAAGYDKSENLQMLLYLGAVLLVRDKDGYTPLYVAAEYGSTTSLDILLEAVAYTSVQEGLVMQDTSVLNLGMQVLIQVLDDMPE